MNKLISALAIAATLSLTSFTATADESVRDEKMAEHHEVKAHHDMVMANEHEAKAAQDRAEGKPGAAAHEEKKAHHDRAKAHEQKKKANYDETKAATAQ